jgi:hypothetical protein
MPLPQIRSVAERPAWFDYDNARLLAFVTYVTPSEGVIQG